MREIKFRGRRFDNGEWVYGSLISVDDTAFIIDKSDIDYNPDTNTTAFWFDITEDEVDPATVGQYTGLKDRDGKEIYEGDSISGSYGIYGLEIAGIIEPVIGGFVLRCPNGGYLTFGDFHGCVFHKVGNIHDNPELLIDKEQ